MLRDDEETCSTFKTSDTCHSNPVCSWCDAAAVKSACHSIENAKRLPSAVFSCSPLEAEPEEDPEDDEEDTPNTLFGQWLHNMRGNRGHGDRNGNRHGGHKGGKHHGDKHQSGMKHHGGKHHRGERPPMEMDEEESFYGRPKVQSDYEEPRGDYEKHGKHGKEHGRHHPKHKHCCMVMKLVSLTLIGCHFFFIRRLNQEQMKVEKIVGKKEDSKKEKKVCGFQQQSVYFTQPVQQPAQQPVVVEYSPIIQNTDSSIEEDKEMGMVYAPNPTGIMINKNTMV